MTATLLIPAGAERDEWLAARTQGLGGSDVAAAVGLLPYKTPFQLWLEKTGRVEPEFGDDARRRMRWGTLLEPLLLTEFAQRHPRLVIAAPDGTYADPAAPWRLASPDALGRDTAGNDLAVIEAKTGNHRQIEHWGSDDDPAIPDHYTCQVQWYLSVLDLPGAHVVALLDTSTYLERELERDDELIELLTEQAAAFWDHVRTDTPPPVDATEPTRKALSRLRAEPGTVIDLGPEWAPKVAEYARLGRLAREIETDRDLIGNELRAAIDTAERAEIDGTKVATFTAPKPRTSVDLDRLREHHPDAYADCVATTPQARRLTVTPPKEKP